LTRSISISTSFDQYQQLATDDILSFPGSVFYNPTFLKISAEILDLDLEPLIFSDKNKIVAICNFCVKRRIGITSVTIPKFFQYYGPVVFDMSPDIIWTIENKIKQITDLAVFSIVPQNSELEYSQEWKITNRLTYYLKPDSSDNLRRNCFEDVKNKLNKASRAGIEIKAATEFPYDIYAATFNRQGLKPPIPELELTCWVKRLTESGLAKTFVAYHQDRPVAFRTQLMAYRYAYDWLAGALPESNSLGVNQSLILTIGDTLFKDDIVNWDLLGGDIKSIGEFKRSFGSIPQNHIQIEREFSFRGKVYRYLMKSKESRHD
jgi:hypothetical protein